MRRGRPTRTHAPRIEFGGFDPPTFLVGFATAKRRGFELERSVSPARGDDAIGDVRAVEPMMGDRRERGIRSEEHTSELQSLMRISYAVFCLKKKIKIKTYTQNIQPLLENEQSTDVLI